MGTRYTTVLNLGTAWPDSSWPSNLLSKHCQSLPNKQTLCGNVIFSPVSYITYCNNQQRDVKVGSFGILYVFGNVHCDIYVYVIRSNNMHTFLMFC